MSIKYLTNKEYYTGKFKINGKYYTDIDYTLSKDDNLPSGYVLITTNNSEILLTEEEYKQQYLEDY